MPVAKGKTKKQAEAVNLEEGKSVSQEFRFIDIDFVTPEANIRREFDESQIQELAESIKASGMLQPIVVRRLGSGDHEAYGVVLGERRLKAARLAGFKELPCRVIEVVVEDVSGLQLAENLQRVDLNALEQAQAISDMMYERDLTQEEAGKRFGKSQAWVGQRLSLLDLPDKVKQSITRGIINASAGEVMARYVKVAPETVVKVAEKMKDKPIPVVKMREAIDYEVAQKCKSLDAAESWNKPVFDPAPCIESCPKVLRLKPYDKERPYCSDPACWEKKNKAVEEALKKAAVESAGAGTVDLDVLGSQQWSEIRGGGPAGCAPDCPQRVKGVTSMYLQAPKTVEACLNLKCLRELEAKTNEEKQKTEDRQRDEVVARYAQKCDSLRYASMLASLPPRLLVSLVTPLFFEYVHWYDQEVVKRFAKQIGWQGKMDLYAVRDAELPKFREALEVLPGYELARLLLDRMIDRDVRISRDLDKVRYLVGEEAPVAPAAGEMEIPDDIDDQDSDRADDDDDEECRICGCTDNEACPGGCYWVDDPEDEGDLCSRCLEEEYPEEAAKRRAAHPDDPFPLARRVDEEK